MLRLFVAALGATLAVSGLPSLVCAQDLILPPMEATGAVADAPPPPMIWAEVDYLHGWIRGMPVPPLVTTSPAGTPIEQAGVLGAPGTQVLFGGTPANTDGRSGARFTLGTWLDCNNTLGVEGHFFFLQSKSSGFTGSSDGSPILARPFIDATTGAPAAQRVAFPGDVAGTVQATASSGCLIGAGILARENLCCTPCFRLDVLGGYRYLHFDERLQVTEDLVSTNPNSPTFIVPGTRIGVFDRFQSENSFHGFDAALCGEVSYGSLTLRVLGKLAVGWTHQVVDITGFTTVAVPGVAPVTNVGGALALSTNSGRFTRDEPGVVAEVTAQLGWDITERLRAWVGYTYLSWNTLARAGDQVNLNVNPGLIPPATGPAAGPQEPSFGFHKLTMWTHFINVGVDFRF